MPSARAICASAVACATRWPGLASTSSASTRRLRKGARWKRAHLTLARADMARARGRSAAREWRLAAEAWDSVQRPYPAAVARWREAEEHVAAGERKSAAHAAAVALEVAGKLGSQWLEREVRGLIERARLGAGAQREVCGKGAGRGGGSVRSHPA